MLKDGNSMNSAEHYLISSVLKFGYNYLLIWGIPIASYVEENNNFTVGRQTKMEMTISIDNTPIETKGSFTWK